MKVIGQWSPLKILYSINLELPMLCFSSFPPIWVFPKCVGFPICPPNGCTTRMLKPPFLEHLRPKDFSMTQFSSEHSKESPRWLRDLLSLFHNNIAQTQRLSGTLAVMAKAIGKAYFMRQRFLLYRWKDIKQFCRQRKPLSNKNDIDPDQSFELFFLTSINISFKLLVYR